MNRRRPFDSVALSVDPGRDIAGSSEAANHPLDVIVVGDFSAREHGGGAGGRPVAERRPERVESVDQALFNVRPAVALRLPDGEELALYFEELDDFHPDRLLDRAPELTRAARASREPKPPRPTAAAAGHDDADAGRGAPEPPSPGLLDDLVAAAETSERGGGALGDLRAWISEVVEPHLQGEGGEGEARPEAEEEALALVLRGVLHHPAVRALERVWRSLLVLARSASASDDVRLYLLDLSRAELGEMLEAPDPTDMPLFRVLESPLPGRGGETPVALLVACHELGSGAEAISSLNRVAMVASALGAPWLLGAEPGFLGLRTFSEAGEHGIDDGAIAAWSAFRATPAAGSVALFGPRFLLREPYGRDGEPCTELDFEELAGSGAGHLWGTSAVLAASAAVEQFARHSWAFDLEAPHVFDAMPIDVRADGQVHAHPVEELLSMDAASTLREAGINPVLGFRGEARARLAGITSAAAPPDRLRSWWRG